MGSRLDLQDLLETLIGSENVYFQPPPTYQMSYPCIVYQRSDINTDYANNNPYNLQKKYMLTVIDPDPDSAIPDQVAGLPTALFDRHYVFDNLNHDVFTIFY